MILTAFKRHDIMFKHKGDVIMNKNPKERTEYIGIRVTPEEKEMLKDLATAAGITLTAFLIRAALDSKRDRNREDDSRGS